MVSVWSPYVGGVVLDSATPCAAVVDQACQQSPAVRRVVERFLQTSVLGQVVGAHMPIVVALAARLRAGEPTPDELVAARQAAEAPASPAAGGPPAAPFGGFTPGPNPSDTDLGAMLGGLNEMASRIGVRPTPPNGAGTSS